MSKKSRRSAGAKASSGFGGPAWSTGEDGEPVAVVGGREPCPCGSGKRYKLCHGRAERRDSARLVTRPFAGLTGECDWVALKEIISAATATVRCRAEFGGADVTVATVLPLAWPGLRRADGEVLLGLQTAGASGDASRDVAAALLQALTAEPGSPVSGGELPGPGPRLQDVLDPGQPFEVTVHSGFDFWVSDPQGQTAEVRESMERANAAVVPTARLSGVEAAYWARAGERCHLRWVMPFEEATVLDGLARLHAAGNSGLGGGRYVGSFRAHGLVVPVWDLPLDTEPETLHDPAAEFAEALASAMAVAEPLTAEQRRARAGLLSRQLTLR